MPRCLNRFFFWPALDSGLYGRGFHTLNKDKFMAATAKKTKSDSPKLEKGDLKALEKLQQGRDTIRKELSKVIIGQNEVVDQVLISIFTRSHSLLVGVPGLAKTLLISTLAETLDMDFKRIQFTPDLMPSDITGTEVLYEDPKTKQREPRFLKGPIFSNIILADEINRTPPKTQAAMLEAMQERKISIGGQDHDLPDPFFVLATQNPIEQEGTYPLPEAQLDRFLFMIHVDYPTADEELDIMKMATGAAPDTPGAVLNAKDILDLQATVRRMPVADHVFEYARQLVRSTRIKTDEALDICKKWLTWGAGPRGGLNLIMAAKARAMLNGEAHVSCADVAAMAKPVLRHRIIPNFAAQSEGETADHIIEKILEAIPQDKKLS